MRVQRLCGFQLLLVGRPRIERRDRGADVGVPCRGLLRPGEILPAQDRLLDEFLGRFESRFVLAHLKDVGVDGSTTTRPEFGTGIFHHAPLLEFLRTRRPDLPLVLEHLPLEHVPEAIARVDAYTA